MIIKESSAQKEGDLEWLAEHTQTRRTGTIFYYLFLKVISLVVYLTDEMSLQQELLAVQHKVNKGIFIKDVHTERGVGPKVDIVREVARFSTMLNFILQDAQPRKGQA